MHHIASYPIAENTLTAYMGQPVLGFTHHGDPFYGILKSCKDGHVHLEPIKGAAVPPAAVKAMQKKSSKKRLKTKQQKANISYWSPYGFGIGRGFGFGLGAGLGFTLPLLAIGALFAAPFWI